MSQRHRRYWDRLAPRYDTMSAGVERRFLAPCRPWVAARVHGRVLEVGVGTGANLAYYPPGTEVVGLERSAPMLAQARHRLELMGRPEVDLRLGDALALPVPDASFETVVSTFTLCCVGDERRALAEMARVLRPGGSVLLADHVRADRGWARAVQAALEVLSVPLQGEHFRRRPSTLLAAAGLEVVEQRRGRLGVIECVHARQPG